MKKIVMSSIYLFSQLLYGQNIVSLKSFIQNYSKKDPLRIESQKQFKESEVRWVLDSDLHQTAIELIPQIEWSETQDDPSTRNRKGVLQGILRQTLATGGTLTVGASESFDYTNKGQFGLLSQKSITFEQPIYGNFLGKGLRLKRQASESIKNEAEINYQMSYQDSCINAVKLYLRVYKQGAEYSIYEERHKNSKRSRGVTKRLYNKKLIRKIDYLYSETDYLSSEAIFAEQKLQYEIAFQDLSKYLPDGLRSLRSLKIQEPEESFVNTISIQNSNIKNSLKWHKLELEKTSADLAFKASKSLNALPVDLVLEAGDSKYNSLTVPRGNYTDQYVKLGVKLSWDFFSETRDQQIKQSNIRKQSIDQSYLVKNLTIQKDYNSLKREIQIVAEVIKSLNKRLKLLTIQRKEAYRLMKAAKLEFNDYISYRDRSLSAQIDLVNKHVTHWSLIAESSKFREAKDTLCWGMIHE